MSMKTFTALHGTMPVLLHVPHAGLEGFHDASDIDSGVIAREMTRLADVGTDTLAGLAGLGFDGEPYLLRSEMTRMECDVERYPDSREEMNGVGMGVIYSRGIDGDRLYSSDPVQGVIDERMGALYVPYHAMFRSMVEEMIERFGFAVILDIHSYSRDPLPYELHKGSSRPQICVGTNSGVDKSLAVMALDGCGYSHDFNGAFRGAIVPEGLEHDRRVHSIMLEIRKDTYLDDDGAGLIPDYWRMESLAGVISRAGTRLADRLDMESMG